MKCVSRCLPAALAEHSEILSAAAASLDPSAVKALWLNLSRRESAAAAAAAAKAADKEAESGDGGGAAARRRLRLAAVESIERLAGSSGAGFTL